MQRKKPSSFTPFPSDYVSQSEKKTKNWNLEWAKAVYAESSKDVVGNIEDNRRKFVNLRRYAEGRQDIDKYKPQINSEGNTVQDNFNWAVQTPAPTIIQSLVGRFENQGLKVQVKAISPLANTEYDKEFRKIKADALLARMSGQLKKLGVDVTSKIDMDEASRLQNDKEIKLHLELNFKDSYSVAMQKAIDMVFSSNKFPEIRRRAYRDAVVCARIVLNLAFDEDYNIRFRVTDLVNYVVDECEEFDFSDAKWMGEYRYYTIDEIAQLGDFTEEQLNEIAKLAANKYGNGAWDSGFELRYYPNVTSLTRPYGRFKVKVLVAEYKSTDEYIYEEITEKNEGKFYRRLDLYDKNGNPKKPKDSKNPIVKKKLANIYKASYIVGTDYIFDYGLKENQLRKKLKGFGHDTDTPFSWVGYAPDMYDMQNSSIMEKLVPLVDQLCITRLQAQRVIMNMTPQGVAVDVAAAAAVANALGEESITPRVLHDIYKQTGTYYYSSVREDGQPISPSGNHLPIRDLPPPDLSLLQQLEARAASIIQDMSLVSGVPLSTVGAPDVKALVGNEKIAAQNRNDATRYIDDTYKNVLTRACEQITLMVQDSIEYGGKMDDYEMAIGKGAADTLDFADEFCAMQFGMFIEVAPDIVEQDFFEQSLLRAADAGLIKQSDVFILKDMAKTNLKAAAHYMQIWEQEYAKEKLQQDTIRIREQSQANAQAALAQTRGEMEKMTHEYRLKIQMESIKAKIDSGLSAQEALQELKKTALEGEQKIEQILTAMMGQDMSGESESATSEYDKVNLPKASGVRMGSLGANPSNQKPNI